MLQDSPHQRAGRNRHGIFQHRLRAAAAGIRPLGHRSFRRRVPDRLPCRRPPAVERGALHPACRPAGVRCSGTSAELRHPAAGGTVHRSGRQAALCRFLRARHCAGSAVWLSDGGRAGLLGGSANHDTYGGFAGGRGSGEACTGAAAVPVGADPSGTGLYAGSGRRSAGSSRRSCCRTGCHTVHRHWLAVLRPAQSVPAEPASCRNGYAGICPPDSPASAVRHDSRSAGIAGDQPHLSAGSGHHDALSGTRAVLPSPRTHRTLRRSGSESGLSGICLRRFHRHGDHRV